MRYITKFQSGGGFASFTPFIGDYSQQSQTTSKETTKKEEEVMDDKIYSKLIGKGLASDVNDFAIKMGELQNDFFGGGGFGNKSTISYLQQIAKVNEISENKKAWDNAVANSQKTGGYGEVAIGTSNELYTRDSTGNIKAISLGQYKENKDKIKLLTVSELLNARNFEKQLANQNGIFNVANNSVGLTEINKKIQSIISAFGEVEENTERSYTKDQVAAQMAGMLGIKKPTKAEIGAFQTLKQIADTPGDIIKVVNQSKTEKKDLDKALDYIWTVLGTNEKQKLTVAGVASGKENPRELIWDMLNKGTSESITSKISGETVKNADGSTSLSSKDSGMKSLTNFQMFHKDKLMTVNNTFAMNDPKTSMLFRGVIGGISPIITADGKSVGMTTVKQILEGADYNQFLQSNNVYFGNKKVDSANINNLIYNGEDAAKVYMPVGIGGSPDFEALGKFKELYAVFEANKDTWTNQQAKDFFKKGNYNLEFEDKFENGKKVKSIKSNASVKPFLVMYGYTNDATGLTKNNPWITEFNKTDEALIPQLENIWTIKDGKKSINLTPDAFGWEDYYKGMIAIPYRDDATAKVDAMVGQGPKDRQSTILDVQRNLNFSSNQSLNTNNSSLGLK